MGQRKKFQIHKFPLKNESLKKIEKFQISKITHQESFYDISKDLGVSDAEIEKAFELAVLWEKPGYLEVYEDDAGRQYGRVKKLWIRGDGNVVLRLDCG